MRKKHNRWRVFTYCVKKCGSVAAVMLGRYFIMKVTSNFVEGVIGHFIIDVVATFFSSYTIESVSDLFDKTDKVFMVENEILSSSEAYFASLKIYLADENLTEESLETKKIDFMNTYNPLKVKDVDIKMEYTYLRRKYETAYEIIKKIKFNKTDI